MSKPPLFFIVIIGLIVVAASFRFMQQRREKADNDMAPLQQKLVVVSNKREKPINDRRSRQQEVTPAGTSMRYEASFKPQSGGMEQTFRLDAQQYHALTVGDQGTLSYKGTRFVSFVGERIRLFFNFKFLLPDQQFKHAEKENPHLFGGGHLRAIFR